ncbi:MAG: DUF1080 domain-containing protein, partial [Phycisphaerae bacterium]
VEDGAITGRTTPEQPTRHNTFLIWRQGELDDFELTLEYKVIGGNSGIQYRSFEVPGENKWVVGGYQADFEAGDRYSGILYGEHFRGILAERGQKTVIGADHKPKVTGTIGESAELAKAIRKEDWNAYRVIARGFTFVHEINGRRMIECTDEDLEMRRRGGILALQLHAGPPMTIQVRNIRLKRLPMEGTRKIVLIAGPASHGHMEHEHYAGCRLLADALNAGAKGVYAAVYRNGWPKDPTAFDNADALVMYCDGGNGHMVNPHLAEVDALMKKGVGLACLHYGVEVPKEESGPRFLDWIGGYFETWWSVNPHWLAEFKSLPEHPITRGVRPFSIQDEWYYHMRFRPEMKGVTPILVATPPESTLSRPDGPHSGNPHVRAEKGKPQILAWAAERADGGRGFGFTGGHFHYNWGHNDFRKLVLNALAWIAKAEIPGDGVPSKPLTLEDLQKNQDEPQPPNYDLNRIRENLKKWNP